jgi:DNA-binding transcriptional ArsR family regulator
MKTITNDIEKLAKMAGMLKAIAHPTRVAIIALLQEQKWMNVTEIYSALNIEQAVASQQLAVLKTKGVLLKKKEGNRSLYAIKHAEVIEVLRMVEQCQDC